MVFYDDDGNEIPDEELPWSSYAKELDPCDDSQDWVYQDDGDSTEDSLDTPVLAEKFKSFPEDARSAAERRKRVAQSVRDEALRRLELSARTAGEFQSVVNWYDREEQSRMRRERRYESLRGDTPVEYLAPADGDIVPHSMSCPTFRQLCRGEFDDLLCNCLFRMHDLTDRAHLRQIVMNLKQDHKEILYFLGVRLYSTQQLALLREQTERNIRKVRGTVQRKIHKKLFAALTELAKESGELTHQEQAFLKEYKPTQRRCAGHDGKPV
ncbi:MAG: sigma-70 family RNA polymerase sigma factor [Clostridiales bacterium]|nr:sigma-70 family RNA polymerase sigma factor [Clostridiales bacterium]MDD7173503.1 sigma-70 family RNA polymerase sigma factor [Clostridiales bacterium]MDY5515702.1 sigma-70 family RNA polymerase sigma factor [Candidatus Ventricola sp.]